MAGKSRKLPCGVCGKKFRLTGRKYCSPACSKRKQQEQLAALAERRKAARPPVLERPCDVCGTAFTPRSVTSLYCSDPCRAEGLRRAVERQKERRQKTKAEGLPGSGDQKGS